MHTYDLHPLFPPNETNTHTHARPYVCICVRLSALPGIGEYLHAFVYFFHMIYDLNCCCSRTYNYTHIAVAMCVCVVLGRAPKYATLFVL